jgi:phosphoribosylglycinamide formyltransferase-1
MPDPVIFAYDFPHKKSQDVILRLIASGRKPKAVLAAPPVALEVPPPAIRVKPRHADLVHPGALCDALGIEYVVVDHRSDTCLLVLDELRSELGVVAGARILPPPVLERFPLGVINLHPGLLPQVRGLDALQWALYRDQPLGVTSHLIDARVDAGWILERREIEVHHDDTLVDLGLRLYETQLAMLDGAIARAVHGDRSSLDRVGEGPYNRSFPAALVPELERALARRRTRAASAA